MLVLVLLAGVLAMHGLGPTPAPTADRAHGHHAAAPVTAPASAHSRASAPCGHTALTEGGHDGHLRHADATCAAAGVAGAPALPDLVRSAGSPVADTAPTLRCHSDDRCTRAPPSLSALQLLRI